MKNKTIVLYLIIISMLSTSCSLAQSNELQRQARATSDYTKSFISIDTQRIAFVNAKIIDGTGGSPKMKQTILSENGVIINVGPTSEISIPLGYFKIDLTSKTLIPGIVGTHNHMRLPQGAMLSTSPKLYLASGVTTIQTCGTGNPYEEIEIAKSIARGDQPGPEIINSGPYLTGPDGKSNFIRFTDEQMIRDTIEYWAKKGVKWLKVYRNTRPEDLKIIIEEAHKHRVKVTGHLCATTFSEAAALGIDAIEHGFIHSYDHEGGKEPNTCSGNTDFRNSINIRSQEVQDVQQTLIDHGVALGSTLSIFEAQANAEASPRDLEAMSTFQLDAYNHRLKRKKELGSDWYFKEEWLEKSMEYDLQFFRKGGLLVAGLDPGLHNMPGYGDQKNYQLFIQAGFKVEEAIQVMTSNGAKLLGKKNIGTIQKGKIANLVVLNGDLELNPDVIKEVEIVFKNGVGFDPIKLVDAIKGNVGSQTDDLMTYFGQKEPSDQAEIFAPYIISKPGRYEFGCTISKNGKEFYFGIEGDVQAGIYCSKLDKGVWTSPEKLFKNASFSANDPMLSPDGNRLYFISNKAVDQSENKANIDIWYAEREGEDWSEPINAGSNINTGRNEYFISFSKSGTMYFASNKDAEESKSSNFDIYSSAFVEGQFLAAQRLPAAINTDRYEADVFIAPDESYMIFCAIRPEGFGNGDLYISFKDDEDNWTPSINMGDNINSENHELCPYISPDGKYFFYTSKKDIYWVSTSIIEQYKERNRE